MRIGTAGIMAITVLAGTRVLAQAPTDGSAQRAAIERVGFMVGRWSGEAWMQRGPQRVTTTMTETVQRKLGGAALLIEGRGVLPATRLRRSHSCALHLLIPPRSSAEAARSAVLRA